MMKKIAYVFCLLVVVSVCFGAATGLLYHGSFQDDGSGRTSIPVADIGNAADVTKSNNFSVNATNNFVGGVIVSNLQVGVSTPDNSPYGVGRPGFTGDLMDIDVTSNFPTIQILQTTSSGYENGAGIRLKSLAAGGVDWIISSTGQADIRGAKMFQLWNNDGGTGNNPGAWFWIDPAGDVFGNSFNSTAGAYIAGVSTNIGGIVASSVNGVNGTFTNLVSSNLNVGWGLTPPGNIANFITPANNSLVSFTTAPYNANGSSTGYGNGPGFALNGGQVGGGSWYVSSQGNADGYPGQLNFYSGAGGGDVHFDTSGNVNANSFVATANVTTPSLIYTATNAAPANTTSPIAWMQVKVGGTNYEVPLYK